MGEQIRQEKPYKYVVNAKTLINRRDVIFNDGHRFAAADIKGEIKRQKGFDVVLLQEIFEKSFKRSAISAATTLLATLR